MAGWEQTEGREGPIKEIMPPLHTEKLLYYRHSTGIMVHACPSVLISRGIPQCMVK